MGEPGFWDDPEAAGRVGSEHARETRRLTTYEQLASDVDDLEGLVELAEEDPELAAEVEQAFGSVESRLEALEEERLFSGPYDAGDALVTVNAGAGGTDAQDWAEMVLRMLMRWAERRGFEVELLEASAGEEAGIKSATFRAKGENAYGLYARREGRAPARAAVAVRRRPPPPDLVRGRRGRARGRGAPARSRSTTRTSRSTPTAPPAPAASTSTRPTRPSASPTSRPASSCSARTSARSRPTRRPRWRCCAPSSSSSRSASAARRSRKERGEAQDVNFGSQIRSYVLHPYTMVKDHRTDEEMGDANRVLDGDLDGFVRAYLLQQAKG